jgi:hypothetical protein
LTVIAEKHLRSSIFELASRRNPFRIQPAEIRLPLISLSIGAVLLSCKNHRILRLVDRLKNTAVAFPKGFLCKFCKLCALVDLLYGRDYGDSMAILSQSRNELLKHPVMINESRGSRFSSIFDHFERRP